MFQAHVLIIRSSKLHYTASGIITPIGGRLVHRLRVSRLSHQLSQFQNFHSSVSFKTLSPAESVSKLSQLSKFQVFHQLSQFQNFHSSVSFKTLSPAESVSKLSQLSKFQVFHQLSQLQNFHQLIKFQDCFTSWVSFKTFTAQEVPRPFHQLSQFQDPFTSGVNFKTVPLIQSLSRFSPAQ